MTYQDLLDAGFEEYELERRIIQNGETIEEIAQEYLDEQRLDDLDEPVFTTL